MLARALLIAALLVPLWTSSGEALVLYDTYGFGQGTPSRLVGKPPSLARNFQYADPIDVTGDDYLLESITLRLRHEPGAVSEAEACDFEILLRADDAGEPGAILEEWLVEDYLPNITDVELLSVDQPLLGDGQRYWVHVKSSDSQKRGSWLTAADTLSSDWLFANTNGLDGPWSAPPEDQLLGLMTVEVPEPGQALLLAVGASVLLGAAGASTRRAAPREPR